MSLDKENVLIPTRRLPKAPVAAPRLGLNDNSNVQARFKEELSCLYEKEAWRGRAEIITKADHEEHKRMAREIILETIGALFAKRPATVAVEDDDFGLEEFHTPEKQSRGATTGPGHDDVPEEEFFSPPTAGMLGSPEWDALGKLGGNSSQPVTRQIRDSIYVKFDPLAEKDRKQQQQQQQRRGLGRGGSRKDCLSKAPELGMILGSPLGFFEEEDKKEPVIELAITDTRPLVLLDDEEEGGQLHPLNSASPTIPTHANTGTEDKKQDIPASPPLPTHAKKVVVPASPPIPTHAEKVAAPTSPPLPTHANKVVVLASPPIPTHAKKGTEDKKQDIPASQPVLTHASKAAVPASPPIPALVSESAEDKKDVPASPPLPTHANKVAQDKKQEVPASLPLPTGAEKDAAPDWQRLPVHAIKTTEEDTPESSALSTHSAVKKVEAAPSLVHSQEAGAKEVVETSACGAKEDATTSAAETCSAAVQGQAVNIMDTGIVPPSPMSMLKYSERDLQNLKQELKQATDLAALLTMENQESANKAKQTQELLAQEQEKNRTFSSLIEQFEATIAEAIDDSEKSKREATEGTKALLEEKNQLANDLQLLENSFSDLLRRNKDNITLIDQYKKNEQMLKEATVQAEKDLENSETRYKQLQAHAEKKIQMANEEIARVQAQNKKEMATTNARLKKETLRHGSLASKVASLTKENAELLQIMDEMMELRKD